MKPTGTIGEQIQQITLMAILGGRKNPEKIFEKKFGIKIVTQKDIPYKKNIKTNTNIKFTNTNIKFTKEEESLLNLVLDFEEISEIKVNLLETFNSHSNLKNKLQKFLGA